MATVCAVMRLQADVVPAAGAGVAVVPQDPAAAADAAQDLSRTLRGADVLLLVRSGDHVTAERWRGGALQDAPAAGLLLSGLPEVVERLLLSGTSASSLPGAVSTAGLARGGRLGALWRLVRTARRSS
jgi:hypothetical protein